MAEIILIGFAVLLGVYYVCLTVVVLVSLWRHRRG